MEVGHGECAHLNDDSDGVMRSVMPGCYVLLMQSGKIKDNLFLTYEADLSMNKSHLGVT